MKAAIFLILLILVSGCLSDKKNAVVVDIKDGDTLIIEGSIQVRLLGINTPERGKPYYDNTTKFLRDLVQGKRIKLEADSEDVDQYGRLLRHIFLEDIHINKEIIKAGFANSYYSGENKKYEEILDKEEKKSWQSQKNLWKRSEYFGCIKIEDFHYDTEGNDCQNLRDEYIKFRNLCDNIDMSQWTIKDEANNFYKFQDVGLYSGGEFTLYTGNGTNQEKSLYWDNKVSGCKAIWNNNRDSIYLHDDEGDLVLTYKYKN